MSPEKPRYADRMFPAPTDHGIAPDHHVACHFPLGVEEGTE